MYNVLRLRHKLHAMWLQVCITGDKIQHTKCKGQRGRSVEPTGIEPDKQTKIAFD